jgi:hypothetical protein
MNIMDWSRILQEAKEGEASARGASAATTTPNTLNTALAASLEGLGLGGLTGFSDNLNLGGLMAPNALPLTASSLGIGRVDNVADLLALQQRIVLEERARRDAALTRALLSLQQPQMPLFGATDPAIPALLENIAAGQSRPEQQHRKGRKRSSKPPAKKRKVVTAHVNTLLPLTQQEIKSNFPCPQQEKEREVRIEKLSSLDKTWSKIQEKMDQSKVDDLEAKKRFRRELFSRIISKKGSRVLYKKLQEIKKRKSGSSSQA